MISQLGSVKKAPISAEIIKSIIDNFGSPSANLENLYTCYLYLLDRLCRVFSL